MESENRKLDVESKEQTGRYNEFVIDLVRHGESKYTNTSPDLTEVGQAQIEAAGRKIGETIKPEERVVIWSSPAMRAKDSSQIIRDTLAQTGVNIAKEKEVSSLRPIFMNDRDFVLQLFKEAAEQGAPDTVFMTHPEFAKDEHEKMETRPQVEKRIDRIINYLRYLVEHVDFKNQPLRIIMVSHFELAESLAQEVFGNTKPFVQGEVMEIKMRYDRQSKQTEIYLSFRGEEKGPLAWDKEKRELIK